jgi:2-polyprenyl-6-methoxyphenol hydroxylase-like FAD-dependent oxidoreductase
MISIIGGGIGGLSLGVGLAQKGLDFHVFEQAAELKPVGAGIMMASNAMQIYGKWGLAEAIADLGVIVNELRITDEKFRTIVRTDLRPFAAKYKVPQVAIHRADLLNVLAEAVGIDRISLDHTFQSISSEGLCSFQGEKAHLTEWLVGADGIHSKVRASMGISVIPRSSGQHCWRGVCDFDLPSEFLHTGLEAWGKGQRFGFTRIGEQRVYWYAVADFSRRDLDFSNFPPLVTALIKATESIHFSEIQDLPLYRGWSRGKCVLLGDAAHATTPNMGQGACQAVEDAYVLSHCMRQFPEEALVRYEALRVKKAHQIINRSRRIGQVSHINSAILRSIRNGMMRKVASSAPFETLFDLKYPF